jgi:hypothetical protein
MRRPNEKGSLGHIPATRWLTDAALAAVGDGRGAVRATSMIAASRLASWHRRHPSWRIVENA